MKPLLPGDTVGIVGGGQLGRMAAIAAIRLGLKVLVLDPDPNCPAAACAEIEVANYSDCDTIRKMSEKCRVLTIEFENLSASALRSSVCPVMPSPEVLEICQARDQEKSFLQSNGFPVPPFRILNSRTDDSELENAVSIVGFPGVVKTLRMGYDGKGQRKVTSITDIKAALEAFSSEVIFEAFVPFTRELSVIVARNSIGDSRCFPVVENRHVNHILDLTIAPAPDNQRISKQAHELAIGIAEKLQLIGLLCVELFETTDGQLLINELAPRPHNSGHWTIEGASISQYEQLWRAIGSLPLGNPSIIAGEAAMVNLLGDLWRNGEPNWSSVLSCPGVNLHLYGKSEARPGRKMGHLTAIGSDAANRVLTARALLTKKTE